MNRRLTPLITALLLAFMITPSHGDTPEAWLKAYGVNVNDLNADNLNRSSRGHGTLMHFAAGAGRVDVLVLLKEQGADINARDNRGLTPLSVVYSPEARKWLRANGAK